MFDAFSCHAGTVLHRYHLIVDRKYPARSRQRLHHLLHSARQLGHRAERRQGEHAHKGQLRPGDLAFEHQPHTHRQHREAPESHHGLHEANLKCLRLLEPHQVARICPTLVGKLIVPVVPASERGNLPHPLDAVNHEGVDVPHSPSYLVAQTLDASIGEVRTHGHCHQERRQHRGYRPRYVRQRHEEPTGNKDRDDHWRDRVREEVLDRLDISSHNADKVAGATPDHIRGRKWLQFVIQVDSHSSQQPESHVVSLP